MDGSFRATGIRPRTAEQLEAAGISLEETRFSNYEPKAR